MAIRVEFFGIPRARSGVNALTVLEGHTGASISEVLSAAGDLVPEFAEHCLHNGTLRSEFIANVDGNFFVADASTLVLSGQSVLVLSADAGG